MKHRNRRERMKDFPTKRGKKKDNCSLQTWSEAFIRHWCCLNLHWKQNLVLSSLPVCQSWPWERERCITRIFLGGIWTPKITAPHLPAHCTRIQPRDWWQSQQNSKGSSRVMSPSLSSFGTPNQGLILLGCTCTTLGSQAGWFRSSLGTKVWLCSHTL